MEGIDLFEEKDLYILCDKLASTDPDLKGILSQYGYPPFWSRPASFETLVHIILEQQVSLASALAALNKLKLAVDIISPQNILPLTNETLKACYFSRQKISYVKHLATEIISGNLTLSAFEAISNQEVIKELTKIKGIGTWSATVYLMMVLHRSDLFPMSDIALISSVRETKDLSKDISKEAIEKLSEQWKPYRTIAAFILWHGYLCKRKR